MYQHKKLFKNICGVKEGRKDELKATICRYHDRQSEVSQALTSKAVSNWLLRYSHTIPAGNYIEYFCHYHLFNKIEVSLAYNEIKR